MANEATILGPIRVRRDGEAIDPGPRQRRLLAALVVADGEVVRSDRLIDIVWGDDAPTDATGSLKTTVTRLRKSLSIDGNPIEFRADGYALDTSNVEIDAISFGAELDQATRLLKLGESDDAMSSIDRALARWGGEAIAEFADEDWARPSAIRLTERRIEARQIRVQALIATGRSQQAAAEASELAAEEPLREGPAESLMRALHADGRGPEALRVVPELRARMIEVGVTPSSDLLTLEQEIASGTMARSTTQVLRGYQLLERIGEGSHASVHRAVQPSVERDVAIKIIKPELADRPDFVRRFEFEARLAARVEHPHVVPLYDYWREPGAAYLVMRLMRGGSLGELLNRSGALDPSRVISLLQEVGAGLARAHAGGIVHRDVRPANILLDESGHGYLADFGIARLSNSQSSTSPADRPSLSPAHIAPEVLAGAPAAIPADVLALGVTVFEMLTGSTPFADSPDDATLVRRQISEPIPAITALRPELGPAIDRVLERATNKRPDDRHATVESLIEDVTKALEKAAGGEAGSFDWRAVELINPYRGLRRFDEADAGNFYGRNDVVDAVIDVATDAPLVSVVGPSGSGKSSVVRAGVLPAIRGGAIDGSQNWFVTTIIPGSDPFAALEAGLLRVGVDPPASLVELLREEDGISRAVRRILPDDDGVVLLVVDQFEELFTLTDELTRTHFIDELCRCVETSDRLRVITTIRADHLDAPLGVRSLSDHLASATIMVGPISPGGLEQAIVEPAARLGVSVEPALVAELVSATADRPSALPLLQFALAELFEKRTNATMTLGAYRELGGIDGALRERAEQLVHDPDARIAARRVFSRLVTLSSSGEPTRRRADRDEFDSGEETTDCIEAFGAARLLAFDHDATTGRPTVEVTHEALLTGWNRLADWVETDRTDLALLRRVTEATATYDRSGLDEGDLGRGLFLDQARELEQRRPDLLSGVERTWIAASDSARTAELEEKERAANDQVVANQRLRRLLGLAACLLVVAVAASAIALVLRGQANERAVEARQASEDAQLGRLVAESAALLETSPDLAALLAIEAYRQEDTVETRGALLRAVSNDPRVVGVLASPVPEPTDLLLNADGSVGLAWIVRGDDSRLQRFDPTTGTTVGDALDIDAPLTTAAISGDGSVIIAAEPDGAIRVIRDDDQQQRFEFDVPTFEIYPDNSGSQALIVGFSEVLSVDLDSGAERWRFQTDPASEALGGRHALSGDGSLAALVVQDLQSENNEASEIIYLDTEGQVIDRSLLHPDALQAAINDDGSLVTTAGIRGDIVQHDPAAEQALGRVTTTADIADGIALGPDGQIALSAASGKIIRFEAGFESPTEIDLPSRVRSLAFTPDGMLIAVTPDGRIWILDPSRTSFERSRFPARFANVPRAGGLFNTAGPDFQSSNYHDIATGEIISTITLDETFGSIGRYLEASTDGQWAFAYNESFDKVAFLETNGGEQHILDLPEFMSSIGRVYLSADRTNFAIGENGRAFVIAGIGGDSVAAWFDPSTGEIEAGPLPIAQGGVEVLLPDGGVAIGDFSSPIAILPPDLASEPTILSGTVGFAPRDVSPDGRILATDAGQRVVLVDPTTNEIEELAGVDGQVFDARISDDGLIAALRYPDSIALFDLTTLTLIGQPTPMDQASQGTPGMAFEENGTLLYLNSANAVSAIEVSPTAWFARACALANRTMTEAEWRTYVSPDTEVIDACA